MAGVTAALDALTPHAYLDLAGSPLGHALRRQSVLNASVDGAPLDTLGCTVAEHDGRTVVRCGSGGLTIAVTMEPEREHNVLCWRLDMRQDDAGPGARLHDLRAATLALDGALAPDPIIHTWLGGASQSFFPPDAVTPEQRVLYPRTPAYYGAGHFAIGTRGGRSSDQYMPYLLIEAADGSGGLWCALGWGGHWTGNMVKPRDSLDLCLTLRIEPCDPRLPPAAHLQGPSVALGLYRGDLATGLNAMRRWLRSRMPPLPGGGDTSHFNTWASMDTRVDASRLLDAVDRVAGHGLRYFMLDAGWYPCPLNNFNDGVGNWRVDMDKFPHGLEVVAERVREYGMHMGLWFEPERAHHDSELARSHPEWLLTAPGSAFALVNFALPAVLDYFKQLIAGYIRRLDLRWLKWDFNMDPLPHWREAGDGGLAHLGHVNGLWAMFDWLRAAFPDLVLEHCASGGNRLDWATFSRAHLNFANDQYTHPDCMRRILGRMASFMPSERLNAFFGPVQHREYAAGEWQVLLGSAFGVSEPVDNWTDSYRRQLRRNLTLHNDLSSARSGDFYSLTPETPALSAWEGWQMHDAAAQAGFVAAWRSGAPAPSIMLRPRGIDEARAYVWRDMQNGTEQVLAGSALARGMEIEAPPDGGALHTYRPCSEARLG